MCYTECSTREEAQLYFQELASQGKSLSIVVTGQGGQGKSKLVNSLIDKPLAKVNDGPHSVTQNVERYKENIDGVDLTMIDTPGFSDPSKTDRDIIGEILKESNGIDLVLFCVRMDRRMQKADYRIMRKLTRTFGKSIWEHALFVLTFANKVDPTKFTSIRAEWDELLREYAHTKGEVPADIVQEIPVVVAGNEEASLPGCESWFADFWVKTFLRTKDSAKPAYLSLTLELNKLDLEDSDDDDDSLVGMSLSQSQIVEKNVRRASEENKYNQLQTTQCGSKPRPSRRKRATSRRSYSTPDPVTGCPLPDPKTGITPHRLTHRGESFHCPKLVTDSGSKHCQSHTTPVPDTGATRHQSTPTPDTGAIPLLPTPTPDTRATPDTGAIPRPGFWSRVLEKVIRALKFFKRAFKKLYTKMKGKEDTEAK